MHPPYTELVGGDLSPEVTHTLLLTPNVSHDHLKDVFINLSLLDQLYAWYDHPVLIDLGGDSDAAWCASTHVYVMSDVGHIPEDLVPNKDR